MGIPEKDELPLVMREIAQVMNAHCCALTLRPADESPPSAIFVDEAAGVDEHVVQELLDAGVIGPNRNDEDAHRWERFAACGGHHDVLLMPVTRIPDHSQLMISAFFDGRADAHRHEAEAVYLRRAPFAVGYFRLWQVDRARRRRVTALEAALDLTEGGVRLMNRSGALVFANEAAKTILDSGDGLRRAGNSVVATRLRDRVHFRAALEHVTHASGKLDRSRETIRNAQIMKVERAAGDQLIISIVPSGERAVEPSDVAAIVYVLDPSLDAEQVLRPICKLYGLSPGEMRLTCALASGATLKEASETLRIKEMTARGTLKQVFTKTGVTRQSELVRLMLSSAVRTTRSIGFENI